MIMATYNGINLSIPHRGSPLLLHLNHPTSTVALASTPMHAGDQGTSYTVHTCQNLRHQLSRVGIIILMPCPPPLVTIRHQINPLAI